MVSLVTLRAGDNHLQYTVSHTVDLRYQQYHSTLVQTFQYLAVCSTSSTDLQ